MASKIHMATGPIAGCLCGATGPTRHHRTIFPTSVTCQTCHALLARLSTVEAHLHALEIIDREGPNLDTINKANLLIRAWLTLARDKAGIELEQAEAVRDTKRTQFARLCKDVNTSGEPPHDLERR